MLRSYFKYFHSYLNLSFYVVSFNCRLIFVLFILLLLFFWAQAHLSPFLLGPTQPTVGPVQACFPAISQAWPNNKNQTTPTVHGPTPLAWLFLARSLLPFFFREDPAPVRMERPRPSPACPATVSFAMHTLLPSERSLLHVSSLTQMYLQRSSCNPHISHEAYAYAQQCTNCFPSHACMYLRAALLGVLEGSISV